MNLWKPLKYHVLLLLKSTVKMLMKRTENMVAFFVFVRNYVTCLFYLLFLDASSAWWEK